ncbi:MAG: PepSY domain-containing protein [Paracoccaceae bacterium]
MKKPLFLTTFLIGLSTGGLAYAEDDDCYVPMANWQPRDAVKRMAEAQGWTVGRIRTDDGCYEIRGQDKNGRGIQAKIDPGSLSVLRIEYEGGEDEHEDGEHEDDDEHGTRPNAAPAGTAPPPDNGLFKKGTRPSVEVK